MDDASGTETVVVGRIKGAPVENKLSEEQINIPKGAKTEGGREIKWSVKAVKIVSHTRL